jgi:hypothetical protein
MAALRVSFMGLLPGFICTVNEFTGQEVPNGSAYACILATVTQNDGNGQSCQTNSDYTLQHENPVHHGISFGCFRHLKTK